MITFKQILAGLMTAGLILGSLPVMGGDSNAEVNPITKWRKKIYTHENGTNTNKQLINNGSMDGQQQSTNNNPAAKQLYTAPFNGYVASTLCGLSALFCAANKHTPNLIFQTPAIIFSLPALWWGISTISKTQSHDDYNTRVKTALKGGLCFAASLFSLGYSLS